jgi:hypothetical protein
MSKGILLGTLSANGALGLDIQSFSATRFSIFLGGTSMGGGDLAVEGGVVGDLQPVMITDPTDGSHAAIILSVLGLYTFDACCEYLNFDLTGSITPDLDLTLFPEPRH